jgi:microcystin-dependent protein
MGYRGAPLHDKAFSLTDQVYSQWETADIKWSASTATSKTGWLLCNGQEVSQTEYKRLWDDIGTTFNTGGESAGKFRVPNIAGRTMVGISSTDADFDTLGEWGGEKAVTLTSAQSGLPAHTHPRDNEHITFTTGGSTSYSAAGQASVGSAVVAANAAAPAAEAHNNMQPSIVLRAWLKT